MSNQAGMLTDVALEKALSESGLTEVFGRLSPRDRDFYRAWVDESRSEEEFRYRIRALIRILHVWKNAF